jgi:glycosyltransferase involved in cell wall biosynthesis
MNRLYILGNEKIQVRGCHYYSANVDFKTIIQGLSENFKTYLIARLSSSKENFRIESKGVIVACSNFVSYIFQIILTLKDFKKNKYLIISITPFTFFAYIAIFLFTNKIYVYLRSDGFKEYENILGKKWVFLYRIMFFVMLSKCKIISCQKKLSRGKKYYLVKPSELDEIWFNKKKKKINLKDKKIRLLYVGRIKIEKGIFNLLNIFSKLEKDEKLTIVGDKKIKLFQNYNIRFYNFFSKSKYLIEQYDKCHIFILPSYTEAHPKVIDEALARYKPVIIFDDIKHIIGDRLGIFICKRNPKDLKNKINYIYKNYSKIVKNISKNILPTKKVFLGDLNNIIINK